MKTSNYILISFLIVFIGGNFISHLAAKNNITVLVKPNNKTLVPQKTGAFSVVVAEPSVHVKFIGAGDENSIFTVNRHGENYIPSEYLVRNDTLFVSAKKNDSDDIDVNFIRAKFLKSVVGKENSNITIGVISDEHLLIKLDHAKLMIGARNSSYLVGVGSIAVQANESDIRYEDFGLQKLDLNLIHSNFISGYNTPYTMSGSAKGASNVTVDGSRPDKIDLKIDKSSSCYIRNY